MQPPSASSARSCRKPAWNAVETAAHFAARRQQIDTARTEVDGELADAQRGLTAAGVAKQQLDAEAAEVNAELRSLRERKSNIPKRQLDLRAQLCRELRLAADTLPFAGELIAVRPQESDWEGAAERLLHSFALSVLVPDEHYRAVSDWIDGNHLQMRIVYYRVPAAALAGRVSPPEPGRGTLAAKLEVKDTVFAAWLERELAGRADAECVETMAEFRRATRAVTKAGQIKGGVRHEKDDRYRIDDRSRYVLGWSNERKIGALLGRAEALAARLAEAGRLLAGHQAAVKAAITRGQVLAGLAQTRDYADIDYQSAVNRIAELTRERERLVAASTELARLDADLETVRRQIGDADDERSKAGDKLGRTEQSLSDASDELDGARAVLAEPAAAAAAAHFGAIADLLAAAGQPLPEKHGACDRAESNAGRELMSRADKVGDRKTRLASRIASAMTSFRNAYPVETAELDSAVEAADGYRELHKRLADDDLPRFQDQFKTYLNQNTIREIAQFQAQLIRQSDLIRERIDTINRSLFDVDYNPGRYIRLEPQQTPNVEIRDFRADLRACTDDAVSAALGRPALGRAAPATTSTRSRSSCR